MSVKEITVTQEAVTKSQPPVCVSVRHTMGSKVWTLHATRCYDLPNQWGGRGRSHSCDHDRRAFDSEQAAWDFAFDHGYTRVYYTEPYLRARRVREARDPRQKRLPTMRELMAA